MNTPVKRARRRTLNWTSKGRPRRSKVPIGSPLQQVKYKLVRRTNTGNPTEPHLDYYECAGCRKEYLTPKEAEKCFESHYVLIGKNWGNIHKGTEIHLLQDKQFPTIDGTQTLKAGTYLIEGFYANVVKLLKGGYYPIGEEFVISSPSLADFYYSTREVTIEDEIIKGKNWKAKLLNVEREAMKGD